MPNKLTLEVNGVSRRLEVDPSTPLIYVLRNKLRLTGTKLGCAAEQCGACAVMVDGESTLSCVAPVAQFQGHKIVTVEGLEQSGGFSEVQRAFLEEHASQCGYCIPGMVIAVTALLERSRKPSETEIRDALLPHLCRCGAHDRILKAVRRLTGEVGA